MGKSLFASKTIWFNLAYLAAGLVATVAGSDFIKDYPQAVAVAASVQGILNVILRLFTKEPIKGPIR